MLLHSSSESSTNVLFHLLNDLFGICSFSCKEKEPRLFRDAATTEDTEVTSLVLDRFQVILGFPDLHLYLVYILKLPTY